MKLELKHLAPYLPYNLKCMAMGEDKTIFEMQGVSDIDYIDLHETGRTVNEQFDKEDVFPILRPLSDLIKEINIDGKALTPIIEMFKTIDRSDYVDFEGNLCDPKLQIDDEWNHCLSYGDLGFSFTKESFWLNIGYDACFLGNQIELFEMLYKWNFDVFGLIEAGLAIDINTL